MTEFDTIKKFLTLGSIFSCFSLSIYLYFGGADIAICLRLILASFLMSVVATFIVRLIEYIRKFSNNDKGRIS